MTGLSAVGHMNGDHDGSAWTGIKSDASWRQLPLENGWRMMFKML